MNIINDETNLNPEQLTAVTHGEGPLLIIAGAGTGKTKVITHRIAHLIKSGVNPSQILALTFTEKAAGEMEERVDRLVPYGYSNVWISTFHSFGDRILRDNAIEIGLVPDFKVLNDAERIIFLKEQLFELPLNYYRPLGNPTKYIYAIIKLIGRLKDEDVGTEEYADYAEKLKKATEGLGEEIETIQQDELSKTYSKYQGLMASHGYLDFGDQVVLPLKLFRTRPHILKRYQEKFRYILVDEFQDTNYAQFQLVRLLSEGHGNITVVGDDDQSIYKFRGAAISNILAFQELYPEARLVTLTKNYRSVQPVLDSAYRLISHNNPDRLEIKSCIDKKLKSVASEQGAVASGQVKHLHFDTLTKEAEAVAEMIEEKVSRCKMQKDSCKLQDTSCKMPPTPDPRPLSYKDFAILVRANNDAEPFLKVLKSKGIPHRFSGNQGLYSREEIRILIAFLNTITDFNDSMSLYHLSCSEIYQLNAKDLIPCHSISRESHKPLYYVMKEIKEQAMAGRPSKGWVGQEAIGKPIANSPSPIASLTQEGIATITKLVSDIEKYSQMAMEETAGRVLYSFLMDTGYITGLSQENSANAVEKVQNIAKFFELAQHIENTLSVKKVAVFADYLDLLLEAGDNPGAAEPDIEADWVQVLTVHKAKGLEFPVVFMVSLVADRFPRKERSEQIELPDALIKDILPSGDFHLQEERRLFYVGMTRAMNELYLTSASDYGGVRAKKISPFVLEALDMPKAEVAAVKTKPMEAIKRYAPVVGEGLVHSQLLSPMPDDAVLSLSHYQIDDYRTCPLKYKYVHILKVPLLPHHSIMYGKAMHEVVSTYFRKKLDGRPASPRLTPSGASLDELITVFDANWRSEGFVTKGHELQRYETGKEAIKKFYNEQEQNGINPAAIERDFVVDLGMNRLKGRWDLIEERGDGPYIIDFKTSDVREQKNADKKTKDSLQLMLYALAYRENFKKLPSGCELHFLESGLVGKAVFEEKHIQKILDIIDKAAKGIRQRDYTAKPDYLNCEYCAFNNICPATAY